MKATIKRILSAIGLKPKTYLRVCFERDTRIYSDASGVHHETPAVIAAKVRIICHTIEKALSLSDCRPDFGRAKVCELLRLYTKLKSDGTNDRNALELAEETIRAYAAHRQKCGLDCSFIPSELMEQKSGTGQPQCGAQAFTSTVDDFKTFPHVATSRHSIRNYSSRPVDAEDVVRAVSMAQTAPSACNRQATRLYAITEPTKISAIKQRHGGIRTFGQPGVIFAIAQDMNMYTNEYERNTWLVDGGIFSMNLMYALNTVGIVNCPVIWGGMDDEDAFIADLAGIPTNERVALLIVGGYAPSEGVKTPCSSKRPTADILKIV